MAAVFTFWQTVEDESEFCTYLSGTDEIVVYPFAHKSRTEDLKPRPLGVYVADPDRSAALFTPKRFAGKVETVSFLDPARFAVDPIQSSVVGYEPVSLRDGALTSSNIYAYLDRLIETSGRQTLERKPQDFIRWATSTIKWLRKRANQRVVGKALPLTSRAVAAMGEGLELVQY